MNFIVIEPLVKPGGGCYMMPNKSQQMRWSRKGADLLLQVRCAVYNGTLGAGIGNRFAGFAKAGPTFAKAA